MADVCISYTSSDLLRAKKLAEWFETSGWSVWMDRDTAVGDLWEDTIREKFDSAKAVVVLWSAEARRSKWVLDEAATAHDAGKLVQVQATGVPLPTPFDRINAVRMPSWGGENEHSERDTLLAAVAVKLGVEPPPPSPQSTTTMSPRNSQVSRQPCTTVQLNLSFMRPCGNLATSTRRRIGTVRRRSTTS